MNGPWKVKTAVNLEACQNRVLLISGAMKDWRPAGTVWVVEVGLLLQEDFS